MRTSQRFCWVELFYILTKTVFSQKVGKKRLSADFPELNKFVSLIGIFTRNIIYDYKQHKFIIAPVSPICQI